METSPFHEYDRRFVQNGLAAPHQALMGEGGPDAGSDAGPDAGPGIRWSREDAATAALEPLFDRLGLKALVQLDPAEPYCTIIEYLAAQTPLICPKDMETRLFLHDLPVVDRLDAGLLEKPLTRRKAVVIPGTGIVTASRKGLKEAFVTAASVCFACFIKFFGDMRNACKAGAITDEQRARVQSLHPLTQPPAALPRPLARGPFDTETRLLSAIDEAGKALVDLKLVDSCFGNISYSKDDTLYISRTGTFLDELEGLVTACSTADSPEKNPDASSELPAHLEIHRQHGSRAILHGHPKFSVILSMDCDMADCPYRGRCYRYCPYERHACGRIPIVSGEVGGGEYGLCRSVAPAICSGPGVIVYGHGVFTCDGRDFNGALKRLIEIEHQCFEAYFKDMETGA